MEFKVQKNDIIQNYTFVEFQTLGHINQSINHNFK